MEDVRARLMEHRNIQDAKAYSHVGNTGGYGGGQASQSVFSRGPSSPLASPKKRTFRDVGSKHEHDANLTNDMLFEKILKIQEQQTSQSKGPEDGMRATFGPTGNITKK